MATDLTPLIQAVRNGILDNKTLSVTDRNDLLNTLFVGLCFIYDMISISALNNAGFRFNINATNLAEILDEANLTLDQKQDLMAFFARNLGFTVTP